MTRLTRTQWAALIVLTLLWGLNWPVMKLAVSAWPPMTFRAASMLLGLPCLGIGLRLMGVPLHIPRAHWCELGLLASTNMIGWHVPLMIALPALPAGRAAILGYTMPVFSALWGRWFWRERLSAAQLLGVSAAGLAVLLLVRGEFAHLGGAPVAALWLVLASAIWALGTQQLRRTHVPVPVLTIAFWMTAITTVVVCVLALVMERDRWHLPNSTVVAAVLYNAVLIFGFCHAAWFTLARQLPPAASSVSICMIPVLGLGSAAWWLNEPVTWVDGLAVALIVLAIAAVLRSQAAAPHSAAQPGAERV
jgi:drug/metabolite transporter (DMT)-like permease